jgi:hypothetical protein
VRTRRRSPAPATVADDRVRSGNPRRDDHHEDERSSEARHVAAADGRQGDEEGGGSGGERRGHGVLRDEGPDRRERRRHEQRAGIRTLAGGERAADVAEAEQGYR